MKTISRRLNRLEDQFVLAGRRPLRVHRIVLCKYGGRDSLDNAICTRTLCADGTVAGSLDGSNDGPGSINAEELGPVRGELPDTSLLVDCGATKMLSRKLAARRERLGASFLPGWGANCDSGRSLLAGRPLHRRTAIYTLPGSQKPPWRDAWRWKSNRDS